MLFVHGNEIEGYYVVTGEQVECENGEDFCIHSWAAETIRFSQPVCIESKFGSPYFKLIGNFKKEVVAALKKELYKLHDAVNADGTAADLINEDIGGVHVL